MYLILFDIDGTLCLTGRAGWRAMNRACQEVVGVDDSMAGVEFAGRTDWSILADIMAKYRDEMRKYYYDPTKYKTYLEQLGIKYPTVRGVTQ